MADFLDDYLIRPDPQDPRLTERVTGLDQAGDTVYTVVTVERALTIFLNSQEIVTAMTIGEAPAAALAGWVIDRWGASPAYLILFGATVLAAALSFLLPSTDRSTTRVRA